MKKHFLAIAAPVLLSIYPALFLYQVNSDLLEIGDLVSLLIPLGLFAVIIYCGVYSLKGGNVHRASNATLILLIFFFVYGPAFGFLITLDLFTVEHRTLLPVMVVLGIYAALLMLRLGERSSRFIQQGMLAILGGLVIINILMITPVEARKIRAALSRASILGEGAPSPVPSQAERQPDIYYLILDEAADFNVIREYWGDSRADRYEQHFRDQGFFIASQSRSPTKNTLYEMASRLNFRYSYKDPDDHLGLMDEISQNEVMQRLKDRGYTTIVFDQTRSQLAYPAKTPIVADYDFSQKPGPSQYGEEGISAFAKVVFKLTMLRPWLESEDGYPPEILEYRDNVLFAFNRIASLDDIPSPKFVYAHLLITHVPFLYKEDGSLNEPLAFHDWNTYLGNYLFAMNKLQSLVDRLLSNADPENLPVIIIQSDHGARNILYNRGTLEDYPERYKTDILNMYYLPGVDAFLLKEDIDPVETFPLLFELYFGESFP